MIRRSISDNRKASLLLPQIEIAVISKTSHSATIPATIQHENKSHPRTIPQNHLWSPNQAMTIWLHLSQDSQECRAPKSPPAMRSSKRHTVSYHCKNSRYVLNFTCYGDARNWWDRLQANPSRSDTTAKVGRRSCMKMGQWRCFSMK